MALAVGDLVDADAVQALQAGVVQVLGDHPYRDGRHGFPGAAQQPGDGGLVGALGQVGHHSFEVAGEPGPGTGPRDRLGADPPAGVAGQPADLGLQVQPRGAQVQVPPAAGRPVIDRSGRPAAGAAQPATSAAQDHHDPGRVNCTPATSAPGMASIVLNAVVARTRRSRGFGWLGSSEPRRTTRARPPQQPHAAQIAYRSSQPRRLSPPANPQKAEESPKTQGRIAVSA